MFELAEMLPPSQAGSALWPLMKQAGVTRAVGQFYTRDQLLSGEQPWDYLPLLRLKHQYEDYGFQLDVIEDRPPMNLTKRGLPGRDAEIETVLTLIENMGRLGIGTWCYQWMTDFTWLRTSVAIPSRGGSLVAGFDQAHLANAPETELGPIGEEPLWDALAYFLDQVIPTAEKWGVRLAMHPDDPPLSPLRGVARIMSSVPAFQRLVALHPSDMNGITLCQGNFSLMTDDMPATIKLLGDKIFFVHMRDVIGTKEKFQETWHDEGPTDMLACFEAYRDIGFDGVVRPDHVPTLYGEGNEKPGYATLGRLFAIGYLRGLQHATFH